MAEYVYDDERPSDEDAPLPQRPIRLYAPKAPQGAPELEEAPAKVETKASASTPQERALRHVFSPEERLRGAATVSERKKASSAANGKKGGRPRKVPDAS